MTWTLIGCRNPITRKVILSMQLKKTQYAYGTQFPHIVLGFQYNIVYKCQIGLSYDNIYVTSNVTVVDNITISIMCILIVILVVEFL